MKYLIPFAVLFAVSAQSAEIVLQIQWNATATNEWIGTACDDQPWAPGTPDPAVDGYELQIVDNGTTNTVELGGSETSYLYSTTIDDALVVTTSHRAKAGLLWGDWSCPTTAVFVRPKTSQRTSIMVLEVTP